uniref:Cytochrome P450 n=1 Tax=Romanomermis culicivorax TaxID=13658 RepID=A0A915IUB2_ROMCU
MLDAGKTKKIIEDKWNQLSENDAHFDEDSSSLQKRRLAFLDLLLLMVKDGALNLDDVQEEVDTFMFEGHDTTLSALNWCLQWIGSQPKVQEKLHQEMDEIFDRQEREVTTDDLKSMIMCFESIHYQRSCSHLDYSNFYTTLSSTLETTLVDFSTIKKYNAADGKTLPAGVEVFIWPYMIHRDPDFRAEPEKFDPDRFSSANSAGRHPFAYVPFSAGPRNCIGQRFAMMMLKTILCWILRRFEIKSCRNIEDIPENVDLVMRPGGGIELELKNCMNSQKI